MDRKEDSNLKENRIHIISNLNLKLVEKSLKLDSIFVYNRE